VAISVRSASSNFLLGGGNLVVDAPTGLASGDYLVAVHILHQFSSASSMTAPAGWTQSGSTWSTSANVKVWVNAAGGSEPSTYTFAADSDHNVMMVCVTGQDTTSPVNVTPTFSTSSSTSLVCPAVTPTVADCLLLCAAGANTGSTRPPAITFAPASGMTERADVDGGFTVSTLNSQVLSGGANTSTGTRTITSQIESMDAATMTMALAPAAGVSLDITDIYRRRPGANFRR
jgi:hypothetical protein